MLLCRRSVSPKNISSSASRPPDATSAGPAAVAASARSRGSGPANGERLRPFTYRAGARLEGTILGFDVAGGTGIGFLSNAFTTPARDPRFRPSSRAQWLASPQTLTLLGPTGDRLRRAALAPPPGRPFALGELRLETIAHDAFPGAWALLAETPHLRALYTGPVGWSAVRGDAVRAADALCVDATFGDPAFTFPPPEESWPAFEEKLATATDAGRAAIVFLPPEENAAALLGRWVSTSRVVRGHRALVALSRRLRTAGIPSLAPLRFAGKLEPGDVLLWPSSQRRSPQLRHLPPGTATTFFLSGLAAHPPTAASLEVDHALPWSNLCDHRALLAFVRATGARHVATMGAGAAALADLLAEGPRCAAYPLVPPTQIGLFGEGTHASRFPASPFVETRGK